MESAKVLPTERVLVDYCQSCKMPFEYCEFAKKQCTNAMSGKEDKPAEQNTTEADAKRDKKVHLIKILNETKKNRDHTHISGLETTTTNVKELGKKLSKKFGCGCGNITADSLEMQGIYKENLVKFLKSELKSLSGFQFSIDDRSGKNKKAHTTQEGGEEENGEP